MGIPDYLKDDHHVHGKLAILEQHQINLRKNYLDTTNDNGLNPEVLGLRFGLKELGTRQANLASLAKEETTELLGEPVANSTSARKETFSPNDLSKLKSLAETTSKILELMQDNVLKEQRKAEWSMLGALIDRVLLILLILAASITTLYIYVLAPVFRQDAR